MAGAVMVVLINKHGVLEYPIRFFRAINHFHRLASLKFSQVLADKVAILYAVSRHVAAPSIGLRPPKFEKFITKLL